MVSRRTFVGIVFTCCFAILTWFAPAAIALDGKLPLGNQPTSELTLLTNTIAIRPNGGIKQARFEAKLRSQRQSSLGVSKSIVLSKLNNACFAI